jgi:hypothetical protein
MFINNLLCFYLDYDLRVLTLGISFAFHCCLSTAWTVTRHHNQDINYFVEIDLESEMCEVTSHVNQL